ncbi:MAG: 30S ribosomal protein S18 [Deltaproteobacteria bacterium]|nr:30S ribosomal protein S18 [Deltaproteobacteria bacterium]
MARKIKAKAPRRRNAANRIIIPRRKSSDLNRLNEIPYKDVELLKTFITERGRIVPRRITGNSAKTQRMLTQAIKRARNIGLLSFSEGFVGQEQTQRG